MSKRRTAKRAAQRERDAEDDGRVVVTTSRGHKVACLPVGAMIDRLRAQYEERMPPVPTYSFTDASGTEVKVPYTAESIADDATPDEDKEAWTEYMAARLAVEAERDENILRVVAVRGVEVLTMPDDWETEHQWMGFDVPDTDHERLFHYFTTEIVSTERDGLDIMAGIYRASGIDEEVLAQIEESFRAPVGEREGPDVETDPGDTDEAEPQEAAGVVE